MGKKGGNNMDIGAKMQNARLEAKLTQEQAAEALGVSRQTISNWETEKTYPDIRSVVRMSDLYKVSLDYLLKGEQPMSNYLDYLEESTNVVKSKANLAKMIMIISYLAIWSFGLIVFWFFTEDSDAMGFGLMYMWIVLPVTTFVLSILIGKNNYWGKLKWLAAPIFGVMYVLGEYATFSAANMAEFNKFNMPDLEMLPAPIIISVMGLAIGQAVYYGNLKKKKPVTCE